MDKQGVPVRYWAALLVICYVATAWLGSARTLISTEVWALHYAAGSFSDHLNAIRQDLVHPPLMYLIHRGWIGLFGTSDAAVKTLPLVIVIPTIVMFTHLASLATSNWRVVSLFFCCGYLAVRVQAMTRMYGLVLLLATLAILLWNRWRQRPGFRSLTLWTCVMVLLVYTHFFGLLLVAGFAGVVTLFGPRRRSFYVACAIAASAWLPWLLFVLPVYEQRGIETNLWWVRLFLPNPLEALGQLPAALMGDFGRTGWKGIVIALLALALHGLLIGLAVWRGKPGNTKHVDKASPEWWAWPMLALVTIPVLILFVYSIIRTPALNVRFVLGIVPPYWLLVGSLSDLAERPGRWILYGAFLPWLLVSTAQELRIIARPHPLRSVAAEIGDSIKPGDALLCVGECNSFYWEWAHRYRQTTPVRRISPGEPASLVDIDQQSSEQGERLNVVPVVPIDKALDAETIWLVGHGGNSADVVRVLQRAGYKEVWDIHKRQVTAMRFVK